MIDTFLPSGPVINDLNQFRNGEGQAIAIPASSNFITAYLEYQDQKAQNTAGGTFTLGAWRTRVLNTEVADTGGHGTLASNQITLDAGNYIVHATAPAYKVDRHKLRLQNVTDAVTVLNLGRSSYASNAFNGFSVADLIGKFTIAASKALELQHFCGTTEATDGFGVESNFAIEVYSIVRLWKIT